MLARAVGEGGAKPQPVGTASAASTVAMKTPLVAIYTGRGNPAPQEWVANSSSEGPDAGWRSGSGRFGLGVDDSMGRIPSQKHASKPILLEQASIVRVQSAQDHLQSAQGSRDMI